MQAVKDHIRQLLVDVGFQSSNIYDEEQSDKSALATNYDSGEFYSLKGKLKDKHRAVSSEIDDSNNYSEQYLDANMEYKLSLRLFMSESTYESRLRDFYRSLDINSHHVDGILRILVEESIDVNGQNRDIPVYYDIVDVEIEHGNMGEFHPNVIEIRLLFNVQYGIHKVFEGTSIGDLPIEIEVLEI